MSAAVRILDANANRAREAIRVMEEAARFHVEHTHLAATLKQLRHDLSHAMEAIEGLQRHRDTPGDVGTVLATETEYERATIAVVAAASGKRLSEALRVIEEYGKTIDPDFARLVEQIRYRAYDVEMRLNRILRAGTARQWAVCQLLTRDLCRLNWRETLRQAVEAGVECVQVRENSLSDADLLAHATQVVKSCRSRGVTVIVNDRPDVALLAKADGVHLGQNDLPCEKVRAMVGPSFIIGVSTSSLAEAKRAKQEGADYCGVGPMFPSSTKSKEVIVGLAYLRQYLEWGGLPHLAIGGVTPERAASLFEAGARGVAVSAAICGSDRPGEAARQLVGMMSRRETPHACAGRGA